MARALWFFVLLTAFFAVAVRCVGALSGATVAERGVALSQGSNAPADPETPTTGATLEDDSDDSSDALLAAPCSLLALPAVPEIEPSRASGIDRSRSARSHGRGLDRPPRA